MSHTCCEPTSSTLTRRGILGGSMAAAALAGAAGPARAAADQASPRSVHQPHRSGMSVHTLGTSGGPVWYPGSSRAGIGTAVVVDGAVYLVDCGDGALRRYRDAGLGAADSDFAGFENLRAFFLTHLHPDHYLDLAGLYLFAPVMGLGRGDHQQVQLYGPGPRPGLPKVDPRVPTPPVLEPDRPTPGFADLVNTILAGNAATLNESMRNTGRPDPRTQLAVNEITLPNELVIDPDVDPAPTMSPFDVYEDDRVRVSAILVPHGATFPAFAFRFDSEYGSVVISGDTARSDNVVRLADETDILIHEVVDPDWVNDIFPPPLKPRQEALTDKLVGAHTPIAEVGSVAAAAAARSLVLTHLSPANQPAGQWLRKIRGYHGSVRVAQDLGVHKV